MTHKQTGKRFQDKVVLIVGASGGLGSTFARAFANEGAHVLLTARRHDALEALSQEIGDADLYPVDLADASSIQALAAQIKVTHPDLSIIVNAAGCDVRKPFVEHSIEEIDRSIALNLRGSMLLTHVFLPLLQQRGDGVIMHIGGFGDGRLAFPFYVADCASRSGLRGFVEAIDREIAGSGVTVGFFSASPADTAAERPFHPLWRQMGLSIATLDQVAQELLKAIEHKRSVYIMGGFLTRLFSTINAAAPRLADVLMMNRYRRQLATFFGVELPVQKAKQSGSLRILGFILIALSFLLYGIGLLILPFTPLEIAVKAGLIPLSLLIGEIAFWIGAAVVGSAVVARYRKWLNPCHWIENRTH